MVLSVKMKMKGLVLGLLGLHINYKRNPLKLATVFEPAMYLHIQKLLLDS